MTTVVTVRHRNGEYPVFIGPGLLADLPAVAARHLGHRRLAVITDRNVARSLVSPLEVPTLVVAAGERSKTRRRWADLSEKLLDLGFGRDLAIVALGGGMVGDLAGFVAATFTRGVPWLMVPTTLLAMVDASVGGKTGVDTPQGKNLIGAFHPPAAVVADPDTLHTLPDAVYRAGLAEAVKHGLVADAGYFEWLVREAPGIGRRDEALLVRLVHRSVEIKGRIVSEDEFETGPRAVLNAGHTVAHAIEAVSGYSMAHGEAVAIGLLAESALAEEMALATPGLRDQVEALLVQLGLPVALPEDYRVEDLLAAMGHDKKNRDGAIRFALPAAVGRMARDGERWTIPAPPDRIGAALRTVRAG
jgi:3-dehydroquinate synthase